MLCVCVWVCVGMCVYSCHSSPNDIYHILLGFSFNLAFLSLPLQFGKLCGLVGVKKSHKVP